MRVSGLGGTTRDLPGHQESDMRKSVGKSTNNYPLAILISALSENGVALKSSPMKNSSLLGYRRGSNLEVANCRTLLAGKSHRNTEGLLGEALNCK